MTFAPAVSPDGVLTVRERADIVAAVAQEFADDVDAASRFPSEAVAALRAQRLLGASVPRELGGEGLTVTELAEVARVLGSACSSTAMVFAMHHGQLLSITRHLGDVASLATLVQRIAADDLLVASATTEVGSGGDVRFSSCFVEPAADAARLRVIKHAPVISYAEYADIVLVTARRGADVAPGDQVLIVAESDEVQLERTSTWNTLGLRGTCSHGYVLTAEFDADRVIPAPYEQISTETMLPVSHVLWAAVWLGMASAAVQTARRFVRAAARRNIGSVPLGAPGLVSLIADLEIFETTVSSAARGVDSVAPADLGRIDAVIRMNNLKVQASTDVAGLVGRALVITGIAGYRTDTEFSLGRLFRDAQGAALMVHNDRILATNAQLVLLSKGTR